VRPGGERRRIASADFCFASKLAQVGRGGLGASLLANFMEEVSMASYKELKSQAEDLMRQAEAARKAETGAAIAEIKAKMTAYGITLADLEGKARVLKGRKPKAVKPAKEAKGAKAKGTKVRKPVAAKYRNPTGGETWSGRGRVPKWLAAELAKGRTREEFLVG
jgi:DNA-binding protein H-NS